MKPTAGGSTGLQPVERFKPTSGMFVGYAGLLVAGAAVVYVLLVVHSLTGLRVALGALLFALVVWLTQLRPRAAAYPDVLVLKNSLRDFTVPLALIDDVTVRHTLNVWVGDERYVCIGIGKPRRSLVHGRERSGGGLLGMGRLRQYAEKADRPALDQVEMRYESWVVRRIEHLVEQARRTTAADDVRRSASQQHAWPETIALVVVAVAFLVSLVL
jgi:hypothetical protein